MEAPGAIGCPSCGQANRPRRRFCARCGNALGVRCATCGTSNDPGDEFCGSCGTALGARPPEAPPSAPPDAPREGPRDEADGERRQLTVVFCDLVGSTELAERLDPEEWREVVQAYQRSAQEVVVRFGGHVAQYLGDGVVVYFGWPVAHEEDAERAVRAGLGLVDAIAALDPRLPAGGTLAVRVGLHTGGVVMGRMGAGERGEITALGDTPNVAARVQALAAPGTVVITATTHRLVSGLFIVEDLGTHGLKGIREPVQLFRVRQPSGVRGRLHATSARGLTPFVGREDERRLLRTRWELASEGDGQVVLVTGEAGIGKSRLVQQFKEDLGDTPHTWIECAGSPYLENTPFHPVIDLLQQGLALEGEASAEERQERLERGLNTAGLRPAEAVPLVAPLVGLPVPDRYPLLLLSSEQQRRRLMATLVAWVSGIARLQPLVLAIEDLHHVDPSTLELLGLLVEQGATEPILLLATARPEFRAPWPMRSHHAQVTLTRLSRRQVRELVGRVAARAALPPDVVEAVVTRTDGVPLFVEEFVRLLVEGEGPVLAREIPSTLQDSLMARLDRLGPAKELAQVAAVLGHEFAHSLLHAVAGLPEAELAAALDRLVDAELLYARGLAPEATYVFRHMLMQDTAYTSLLKSRRRELHRAAARVLTEKFPDLAEGQLELVAHHHTEAGDAEAAIAAWQRAGERAAARSALVEAAGHYTKALHLLGTLPETSARIPRELELQVPLALALRATKGWTSPEAVDVFARARQLGEQLGDTQQLNLVLEGLFTASLIRGELSAAQALADQALRAAERDGAPARQVYPHVAQGICRYLRGDLQTGLEHLERAVALYDEDEHRGSPIDPGVAALSQSALAAGWLGLADRARGRIRDGLALAQRLGSPYQIALAQLGGCLLHIVLRDVRGVVDHAEPLVQLAAAQQLAAFSIFGNMYRAWVLAQQGRHEDGIAQLRRALGEYLASGQRVSHNWYLGWLAEAHLQAGAVADGLATIEDALGAAPEERCHIPELLRLRGDLLALGGADTSQAEATYREAIALAHGMGGKLVELRAATSLGRLLRSHGRAADARALVAPLYGSFTEGFDTRDLVEAKLLLAELGTGPA
jgi:class 3 adenylate cyclase/predicted ATPase